MKVVVILLLCAILSGCAAAPTFETLGDVMHEQAGVAVEREIRLELPSDAVGYGDAYFCGDYYFEVQTLPAGDLNSTILMLSGFSGDTLTVMTAMHENIHRYEWVWCAVGDEGEVICRAVVIDDGSNHYCLTAVAPAALGAELNDCWNSLFSSFQAV